MFIRSVLLTSLLFLISTVVQAITFDYPVSNYKPGSYGNRSFLSPSNHLGEDIALSVNTPIRSAADGKIKLYRSADGYGTLAVAIEHNLGSKMTFNFKVGHKKKVSTSKVVTIYGHLKKTDKNGNSLSWKVGDNVSKGQIIGYIQADGSSNGDGTLNGDGEEHLHFGVFIDKWRNVIYGYTGSQAYAKKKYFASGKEFIELINGGTNLGVFDFWQSGSDATYKASCYESDMILDAQYKVRNNGSKQVYINTLALAVHSSNGEYKYDISKWDSSQWLQPNYWLHLYKNSAWEKKPGKYKLVAKAFYGGKWQELSTQDFRVINNPSCNSGSSNWEADIESFYAKYPNYFGNKVGNSFSCGGNYMCQKYSRGKHIAVNKFTLSLWYHNGSKWIQYRE